MNPIPWATWLRAAIHLGVAPHDFWRLSVMEWLAINSGNAVAPLSRAALSDLMIAFPDTENDVG